jgi:hypothetical protein
LHRNFHAIFNGASESDFCKVDGIKLQSVLAILRQLDALIIFSEMILVRKLVDTYHSYLRFLNRRFKILLKEALPVICLCTAQWLPM